MKHIYKMDFLYTIVLLVEGLKRFTENIQIGFGSFLDKTLQPFTITTPELKLDRDIDQFTALLHSGNTSANFDPMEGGLDALIQAAVCPLAGIDLPNDGHCHMVSAEAGTFIYDYSNKMVLFNLRMTLKTCTADKNWKKTFKKCERCSKCRYRDCVKCIVENEKQTAMINETAIPLACQLKCTNLLVTMVNKFNDSDPCGFIESKECIRNYLVECSNDTVRLNIANQKVCTYPADALFIVLPILAGILGVGLLLIIIWKILTSFYDKIEYARLEHEIQHAKWSKEDNPIYRTPVTTNQNPVYKGGAAE
ncbi:ITB6-like protein [Mya arenaria]|uniref:ITB6-like protein n=1 Tax=Mya arenaria TaxID=6604 RepID=A0ABY7D994_MYAAR|nr:ITB6-like protein [Mya arenaria]